MCKKILFVVALIGLASSPSFAADLGVNLPSSVTNFGASIWNLGYEFQANSNATVFALGAWFDGSSNDISGQPQQVGLWTASGTLLASVFVDPNGTVTDNQWIFGAIGPVALTAGDDYVVGSQGGWDYTGIVSGATYSPEITFITDEFTSNGGANSPLVMPTSSEGFGPSQAGWFGGNVALSPIASPVPEPSSLLLLGSGLAAIGAGLRRKFARG